MKRRHYHGSTELKQNWDSFLDVLTNTVGVLIFVCLFASLVAAESTTIIRTPLESKTEKEPVFYECNNNKVRPLDNKEVAADLSQFMDSLPKVDLYNLDDLLERINQFSVVTSYYRVRRSLKFSSYQDSYVSETRYEPLQADSGESIEEINKPSSEFQVSLKSIDKDIDYVAFLIREDCFSAFRSARETAWNSGFKVGWEPIKKSKDIVFTTGGGRSIGVQ